MYPTYQRKIETFTLTSTQTIEMGIGAGHTNSLLKRCFQKSEETFNGAVHYESVSYPSNEPRFFFV